MPGFFSEEYLEELRDRNDIVDVVSGYVPLKSKGDRHWGLCPFHSEKTPSFSVHSGRGMYYCFGCHAGGNVIHFIMNIEKLSFPESVRFLAERAGISLPDETAAYSHKPTRELKDRLYEASTEAARFFHQQLFGAEGKTALEYIQKRSVSEGVIKRFGLGYAPASGKELVEHLKGRGFTESDMGQAGLLKKGGSSAVFTKRLMFPIINTNGKVAGFGARALDDSLPKYINTSDTPVFNKRKMLYGLNNLQKGQRPPSLIVVEGYMDAIALYQYGIRNAVASLGTALSVEQARLMKRYSATAYIAYDGDDAGQSATLRGLDILKGEGLDVKVIQLPPDMDPDELVKTRGCDGFTAAEKDALPLTEFKLKLLSGGYDLESEDGRAKLAVEGIRLVAKAENAVERERYLRYLQELTRYAYPVLREQLTQEMKTRAGSEGYISGKYRNNKLIEKQVNLRIKTEKLLIGAMSLSSRFAKMALDIYKPEEFEAQEHREIAHIIEGLLSRGVEVNPYNVLAGVTDEEQAGRAAGILAVDITENEAEKVIGDCVNRMRLADIGIEIQKLQSAILASGSKQEKEELTKKLQALTEEYTDMKKAPKPKRREGVE
ncbi:MAG: DNA primase [Bacillota bacterium]|nr:DNA primase [Bacillota bacterium]